MPSSEASGGINGGTIHRPRTLTPGVYVPTPVFFKDDAEESLDLDTVARHAVRLARAGVTGLAVQGSNGEAVNLSDTERAAVTEATRKALDEAGFTAMPLIVGTGAQSTRQTIELCRQAETCGGDAVLVLPPGYYQGLFDKETVVRFFREVADASPLPVIIYNYPGAVSGLDLSSDVVIKLATEHPSIIGAKFTCGNTGKLGRVAATLKTGGPSTRNNNNLKLPSPGISANGNGNQSSHSRSSSSTNFLCFAGSGDFLLPALSVGAAGVIGGIANVAPKTVVKMYEAFRDGQRDKAEAMQEILGRGDWAAIQTGVIGVKVCLQDYEGYGGWARKPLPRPENERRREIVEGFRELMDLEKSL